MTNPYANLPPPPDGYGPWHQHHATHKDETPHGVDRLDLVSVILDEGSVQPPMQAEEWSWFDHKDETSTIRFFALPEGHRFNHSIPEPRPIDTAGMEELELWGSFA